jgi:hypothetical protein
MDHLMEERAHTTPSAPAECPMELRPVNHEVGDAVTPAGHHSLHSVTVSDEEREQRRRNRRRTEG